MSRPLILVNGRRGIRRHQARVMEPSEGAVPSFIDSSGRTLLVHCEPIICIWEIHCEPIICIWEIHCEPIICIWEIHCEPIICICEGRACCIHAHCDVHRSVPTG